MCSDGILESNNEYQNKELWIKNLLEQIETENTQRVADILLKEAIIKQTAMSKCKKIYILADHTKFGVKTAVTFHPFVGEEIITDKILNNNYLNKGIMEVNKWFIL